MVHVVCRLSSAFDPLSPVTFGSTVSKPIAFRRDYARRQRGGAGQIRIDMEDRGGRLELLIRRDARTGSRFSSRCSW